MAVPTITAITPNYGPAMGGAVVKITGTGFALHEPAVYGYVGGEPKESVRIWFGVDQAQHVSVLSSTELLLQVPRYTGEAQLHAYSAVDVTLSNVDEDGDLVPTETVTSAAAFTYKREPIRRPTLTIESPYKRITKELITLLKRELVLNTGLSVHTDYSADGVKILEADLPSVFIYGPDVLVDAYGAYNSMAYEDYGSGNGSGEYPPPEMQTLQYDIKGLSNNSGEFLTLMAAARKFCRVHPYFTIAADFPTDTEVRMPLVVVAEPARSGDIFPANLHEFTLTFQLRRVPILLLPAKATVWPITVIELERQGFNGILVESSEL